jgi:hypothetical protein
MTSGHLILFLAMSLPAPSLAFAEAKCPGNIAPVRYHSIGGSRIETSVRINGAGPYPFIVDTGAEMTIIEPSLADELHLQTEGALVVASVVKIDKADLVRPELVEVGSYAVHRPLIGVQSLAQLQAADPRVRGILGENFLIHFDLLIDRERKFLCLDETGQMRLKVIGEHIPILQSPDRENDSELPQPILISVRLAEFGSRGVVLRLDSGASTPLLYAHRPVTASSVIHRQRARIAGTSLEYFVILPPQDVRIGKSLLRDVAFVAPFDTAGNLVLRGEDGLLPTTLFERVFVSYADSFVILDTRY